MPAHLLGARVTGDDLRRPSDSFKSMNPDLLLHKEWCQITSVNHRCNLLIHLRLIRVNGSSV